MKINEENQEINTDNNAEGTLFNQMRASIDRHNTQGLDEQCYEDTTSTDTNQKFDREAFRALAIEFGGMVRTYVEKHEGEWTQDRQERALLRVYRKRDTLEGITDQRQRGLKVWIALSDPEESMLDRMEALFNAANSNP